MVSFQKIKLGDITEILSGGTPDSSNLEYWKNGDLCWVTLPDLHKKYLFNTQRKITKLGLTNSSAKMLPKNTVIFSSRATIGEISITKIETSTNQGSKNFICNPTKIDFEFLYYCLKHNAKRIKESAGGTTYKEINKTDLSNLEVKIPDLKTQTRIVSVLSAYDDLIENNEKRIKALEEMAQLLYTEWFVKFKFPGHEKVKMVESGTEYGMVPEGWEVKRLQDVCSKITDGSHTSPKSELVGKPMASVKDMFDWGINIESCRKISNEDYEMLVKSDCKPQLNDVLIAKDGSYLKHIFVVHEDIKFVILSSIAILRPNGQFLPNQLAFYLKLPQVKALMKGYVSGVAIPRIVLRDFRKFQIIVPPMTLQRKWAELCDPMIALCHRLVDQNCNFSYIRDLLIPQLVTGKRKLK